MRKSFVYLLICVFAGFGVAYAVSNAAILETVNRAFFVSTDDNNLVVGAGGTGDVFLRSGTSNLITLTGNATPGNRQVTIDNLAGVDLQAAAQPLTVASTPIPGITLPSVAITVPATITPADLSAQLNALGAAVIALESRLITAKIINPTPTPTP